MRSVRFIVGWRVFWIKSIWKALFYGNDIRNNKSFVITVISKDGFYHIGNEYGNSKKQNITDNDGYNDNDYDNHHSQIRSYQLSN